MYIVNPENIENKVSMKSWIAKYFIDNDIPVLSQDGDIIYFANSSLFKECLNKAPFYIKIFLGNTR